MHFSSLGWEGIRYRLLLWHTFGVQVRFIPELADLELVTDRLACPAAP